MRRRVKVYLDTSVISAMVDKRNPERALLTSLFWRNLESFLPFVSELVLLEIRRASVATLRRQMEDLVVGIPSLPATNEAEGLVQEYVKYGAVPAEFAGDAYHVAVAVLNEMDYLLSWNFRHIVRQRTRDIVRMVNSSHGLRSLEIITPAELL